jgi:hypothetical protein
VIGSARAMRVVQDQARKPRGESRMSKIISYKTIRYMACAAVAVVFFAATLYITSDNSTAESIDGVAVMPQVDTFAIMVEAKDLPSQQFDAH